MGSITAIPVAINAGSLIGQGTSPAQQSVSGCVGGSANGSGSVSPVGPAQPTNGGSSFNPLGGIPGSGVVDQGSIGDSTENGGLPVSSTPRIVSPSVPKATPVAVGPATPPSVGSRLTSALFG